MAIVLVVDDSEFMRRRCISLLEELGHETVQASDGLQAVQRYKLLRPNVVLMDITMPNVDGLTALRQIMAIDPSANVAMVTAIDQQGVVIEAMKAGAKAIVVKPYEPDKIKAAIEKLAA